MPRTNNIYYTFHLFFSTNSLAQKSNATSVPQILKLYVQFEQSSPSEVHMLSSMSSSFKQQTVLPILQRRFFITECRLPKNRVLIICDQYTANGKTTERDDTPTSCHFRLGRNFPHMHQLLGVQWKFNGFQNTWELDFLWQIKKRWWIISGIREYHEWEYAHILCMTEYQYHLYSRSKPPRQSRPNHQ